MNDTTPSFDGLSPNLALSAAEEAFGLEADGSFFAYPSYVNRVYGFRANAPPSFMQANPGCAQDCAQDQQDFVVKFYRPGRWTEAAIREEHRFLSELAAEDIPVVCPLCDETGDSLPEL
ncbi:MAG TPA: phosphotransferase, partial [Spirochaetales bacterium]|nr:phosphotransferase [Spirochaetales bacterium]